MSAERGSRANYGVKATNVTADVLAVGDHARASKTVHSTDAGRQAYESIDALHKAVLTLPLRPEAHEALAEDIASLKKAAEAKGAKAQQLSGSLSAIVSKLKMVGVVAKDVAAVPAPIIKLAGLFGVQLPW